MAKVPAALRLVFAAVEALEGLGDVPSDLAGAELHRALRSHEPLIFGLGLDPPSPSPSATYPARARDWFHDLLHAAAHQPGQLVG